jgi:DNA repair protein RecO (recombination protein O)
MISKSYRITGIVLKRTNYGEADRIVTLFTKEVGKLSVIAKGVRKPTSKRSASIELGTQLEALIIKGRGMDILSQTMIVNSFPQIKQDLTGCTQLYQLLEIIDVLTREEQELPEVYELFLQTLTNLATQTNHKQLLLSSFKTLTELLGFTPPTNMSEIGLKSYIESIAERHLKTKDFLVPKSNRN